MSRFLLWFLMLPTSLWQSLGADTAQLRALLSVRLLLDNRQPNQWRRSGRKKVNYRLWGMFVFSAFAGLLYLFPLFGLSDKIAGWTLYYTSFGFLYTFSLITDLSHVLLNTREKYIVQTRPVNDLTLLLARLLHLFSYLFRTAFPMSLAGWWAAVYLSGIKGFFWFPVTMLLLLLQVVFVINLFYIALLRLVKPARFPGVLSYFQIAFAITIFAGFQFLPRLFANAEMLHFDLTHYPIVRAFPAYWLAATWGWMGIPLRLSGGSFSGILAVVLPVVCLWMVIRLLAPQFSRRLALLDAQNQGGENVRKSGEAPSLQKQNAGFWLAKWLTRTPTAEAGFRLCWALTARSRSFRMRMITSLAYLPVYFVFLISTTSDSISATLQNLPETNLYLMLLYMISFVVMQSVGYMAMSEDYKAAWIFRATPVAEPGRLILGGITAVWVQYILPFFVAVSGIVVSVWGLGTLPDILLAAFNIGALGLLNLRMGSFYLPFSVPEKAQSGGRSGSAILRAMVAFLVPVVLGGVHYLALHLLWLKLVFMVLSGLFFWLLWTGLQQQGWEKLNKSYRSLE